MYRIGAPFWKVAARAGVPMYLRVRVREDAESHSFWASSDGLDGLVVSGASFDDLRGEIISAASMLLSEQLGGRPLTADMRMTTQLCAA